MRFTCISMCQKPSFGRPDRQNASAYAFCFMLNAYAYAHAHAYACAYPRRPPWAHFTRGSTCKMRAPGRPDLEHANLVSSVVHLTERFTCVSICQKPSFGRLEGVQRAEMLKTRAK